QNPSSSPLLAIFRERLNSPQFLDYARAVTGIAAITRADIHATPHRAGHCVNFHTTLPYSAQGGRRVAGFEINFTLEWRPEWGGLHTFKTLEDYTAEACIPSFNLLDLFGCHKGRWISTVSDSAAGERLAVAGWLYAPESE